jgi:hypothetical protein
METRTPRWRWFKVGLGCLAVTFCMGSSCLDPCQQLADKICSCEANATDKQTCTRQVAIIAANRKPNNNELVACQQFLLNCECRALKAGDLQACGLSRE